MKKRSRLLFILFPLLGVLCLAATLFSQNKSETAKSEFIPVSLASLLEADYRANLGSVRLPALRLELIWDAISDREPHVADLNARRIALLDSLQTPVPVVTPSACQGSHIVYASQDTWLDSAQPTATHGDDPSLSIGRDGDQLKHILLFFPIGDSLPPGVYIKTARLELVPVTENAEIVELQLFSLATPFAELTTSWSNQPPSDLPYRAAFLPASKVHSWDLTDMVQNWLLDYDSMSGLLLKPAAAFDFTQVYYSREADRHTSTQVGNANQPVGPRLVIDCGSQPQQPPAIAAAPQTAIPGPTPIPTSTGSMTPLPPAAPTQTAVASPPPTVVIPTLPPPSPTTPLPSPSPAPTQPPALPSPTSAPSTPTTLPPTPTAPPSTDGPDDPDEPDPPLPVLAINGVTITEGDGGTLSAIFDVTLSAASPNPVTVDFTVADNTATAPADYIAASGSLTFAPGVTRQSITVLIQGDTLDEPDETFFVTLFNPCNASLSTGQALGRILDDDPPPALSIADVTTPEGDSGVTDAVFTVSLSTASGQMVTVDYSTLPGTAAAPADYLTTSGLLTFPPGALSQTIRIAIIGDTVVEANETFLTNLTNPVNAAIAANQAVGTILNDDGLTISIGDVTVMEGDTGTVAAIFTVSLSTPSALPVQVDYATADNSAAAPADYTAIPTTTLTFAPLVTVQTITVTVQGDTLDEADETFFINLSGATNATIADNQGLGIITDNDNSASLCASPMITLTATADTYLRSNQSDSNFGSDPDLRTKPPDNERNTLIQFDLATVPPNSLITCAALLLTQTSLSDTGQNVNIHRITTSWLESQATWAERLAGTPWDTPGGGGDFDLTIEATFVPSATNHAANVTSLAQFWLDNPTSNFGLLMEAQNAGSNGEVQFVSREDGGNPSPRLVIEYIPTLSINDVTVTEGDSGTTSAVFTVTLSSASSQTVTVNYATSDGTATTADNDYVATSGALTFSPGVTAQPITVMVTGDLNSEATETFLVNLSNPANAAIGTGQGIGTILQDMGGLSRPAQNSAYLPLIVK